MTGREALQIVRHLADFSDRGRRGRPGIKGTQKHLDAEVQLLVKGGEPEAAAKLIAAKVREAYRVGDSA